MKMNNYTDTPLMTQEYDVTDNVEQVPEAMFAFARFISIYLQPFIFGFGLVGNLISLIIFMSESMRKISSNLYLAALSGSSFGFNLVLLCQWLEMVRINIMHMEGFCQSIVYFGYVFGFLSVWFIVCITIENYIVTFHLSKAVQYCTVTRAKLVILLLILYAVLLYSGQFWTTRVVKYSYNMSICSENPEYFMLNKVYSFWDTITTIVLPIMITSSLIVAILSKNLCLCSVERSRDNSVKRRLSKKQKSLIRITRVLLAISMTYVILSGPSHANKLRHLILTEVTGRINFNLFDRVLQQILQIIYYLSFCFNIIFYLIWSNNFRNGAKRLLGIKTRRRRSCSDGTTGRQKSENQMNGFTANYNDQSEKITIL